MKRESVDFLNKKIKNTFFLIKNVKKIYNSLNKLLAEKKELEEKFKFFEISEEYYHSQLREINKRIFKLESKIYIYLGKIKYNVSTLIDYIKEDHSIEENIKKEIFENVKEIVNPILEYQVEDQKISSKLFEIEEELSRAENILDINKIEKFKFKKEFKQKTEEKEEIYKVKKKFKKDIEKIEIQKILLDISDLLFGKISNYLLEKYPDIHYRIRKMLFRGKINVNPSKFLSFIFFIVSIAISVLIIFLIYAYEMFFLTIIFIFILVFPILLYTYIIYREKEIRKEIDINLPFASVHLLSLLQTGIDIENCFRFISETGDYGFLSLEFKRLADLLNSGISLSDAIEHVRDTTVSERLREFLDELLLTLRSGRNIKEFFIIYTENQLLTYRTDLEKLNQVMKNFSDLYVGLVLTIPMLIISVGIMLSTLSSTIFGLSISEFLKFISIIVLPIINIGVMLFISKLEI
ncbi:MAG: type II secretion system F family protein [Nanopusillaceae archaeon]